MDSSLFNTLLHRTESETLDFKREQYKFYGAGNAEKGELLKDVLAFANAWKSTDAYILIGVEEVTGAKAIVTGVNDHLKDADIQQFVNSKTNRQVRFLCGTIQVGNTQVDYVRIQQSQDRPIFLTKDFGNLKANTVYIRHGSATAVADPQEIAEIGASGVQQNLATPVLEFEFAEPKERLRLGHAIVVTPLRFTDAPEDYDEPSRRDEDLCTPSSGLPAVVQDFERQRELVEKLKQVQAGLAGFFGKRPTTVDRFRWRQETAALCAVGFWARNAGTITANDARAIVTGPRIDGLVVWDETTHPCNVSTLPGGASYRMPVIHSDVRYSEQSDQWRVTVSLGKLQPQAEFFSSHLLYLGALDAHDLRLQTTIFADDLKTPIMLDLEVAIRPVTAPYDESKAEGLDRCKCLCFAERCESPDSGDPSRSELR